MEYREKRGEKKILRAKRAMEDEGIENLKKKGRQKIEQSYMRKIIDAVYCSYHLPLGLKLREQEDDKSRTWRKRERKRGTARGRTCELINLEDAVTIFLWAIT